MGRKIGGCFRAGKLGPHLTQCRLGRGLTTYQVDSIHPAVLASADEPKIGGRVTVKSRFFTRATLASAGIKLAVVVCLSVCPSVRLSQVGVLLKRLN